MEPVLAHLRRRRRLEPQPQTIRPAPRRLLPEAVHARDIQRVDHDPRQHPVPPRRRIRRLLIVATGESNPEFLRSRVRWCACLSEPAVALQELAVDPSALCRAEERDQVRAVPRRAEAPQGVIRAVSAFCSSDIHPVSVGPGLIALQVTPRWASSRAPADVIRSMAPLLAPYGRLPAVWSLVRLTIRPLPCRPRNRSPYSRISSQVARALTAKCRSKLSTVGPAGPSRPTRSDRAPAR